MMVQSGMQATGVVALMILRALHPVHEAEDVQATQFGVQGLQTLPLELLRLQKNPASTVRQSEEHPSPLTVL